MLEKPADFLDFWPKNAFFERKSMFSVWVPVQWVSEALSGCRWTLLRKNGMNRHLRKSTEAVPEGANGDGPSSVEVNMKLCGRQ